MPCTNYHFFFSFFYHFSLFFISENLIDMCSESSPPRISFFFFILAKQAVPIDLKPTHCFWAQILILSSACAVPWGTNLI